MIRRVWERATEHFENCFVATDDERIHQVVRQFGGQTVMTSPDHPSGTDRCAEALEIIERERENRFDVVVNIQGDEPFLADEHLLKIKQLFENSATRIATLVKPFADGEDIFNPNTPKVVIGSNGNALYFSRSAIPHLRGVPMEQWQKTHTYYKHIGLYAYTTQTLREITRLKPSQLEHVESLEQLRWLENGYAIATAITHTETIAIDTPEDLQKVLREL